SAPDLKSAALPPIRRPAGLQVQFVNHVEEPVSPPIGKVDLDRARALLSRARGELQPKQWELLDRKLAEAERAWERHEALANSSGRSAEVPRAPLPVAALVSARTAAVETAVGTGLGPLFLVLVALWPVSTGNGTLTPPNAAQLEVE